MVHMHVGLTIQGFGVAELVVLTTGCAEACQVGAALTCSAMPCSALTHLNEQQQEKSRRAMVHAVHGLQ